MELPPNVHVLTHPLIQQKLALARDRRTDRAAFRRLVAEIAALLVFESMRDCPTEPADVNTPLGPAVGATPATEVTLVPILRAGLPMADGVLAVVPQALVGHLGIYRDETSLEPVVYYNKPPPDIAQSEVIILDAMVATGGSAAEAVSAVKQAGATRIRLVCLVAAPSGIQRVRREHPDVSIFAAAVDDVLDRDGYIVPGLGDAGERLFGTR